MVYQGEPLRLAGQTSGPTTPESLMISALLESGEFTPERYHLDAEDLTCWSQLWHFCANYQHKEGKAPGLDLVKRKYPEFEPVVGVGANWAADLLHNAAGSRRMRNALRESIQHLDGDDVSAAYQALADLTPPRSSRKSPVDGFSAWTDEKADINRIGVPWDSLGRATGGIGPGELWYSAGRPGVGKTFTLCHYTAEAISGGVNVAYLSLEMPARVISKRVMRDLAARHPDPKLLAMLDSGGLDRQHALTKIRDNVDGHLHVVDPSHGRATSSLVRELLEQYDLLCIDHVGLMSTSDGRRAIDDWRAMAVISNQLKEDVLATNKSILGAAQLNRDAENESQRAPKASTLSQSKALEEDGDVVVTMKRLTERVMIQAAVKVREGAPAGWYSLFDPVKALFKQMTREKADALMNDDRGRQTIADEH